MNGLHSDGLGNGIDLANVFARRTRGSAGAYGRARKVMPGGNTRQTVFTPPYPIYADRAKGCCVTDVDGNVYCDFVNNYSALIHGHNNAAIRSAVREQLDRLVAIGLPSLSEIALAELLCDRVTNVEHVRFTNSGTEAVMIAIKAARAYTGRAKIAKIEGSYHGTYDFAEVSQSPDAGAWGDAEAPASVPFVSGTPQIVLDSVVVLPMNDSQAAATIIAREAADLAAVIIDPLVARMSYAHVDSSFLNSLRELTTKHGILFILDEVYSLRLHYGGAQSKRGISPDLTVMGKIIGGGFPIGAVGGPVSVMGVFDPTSDVTALPHGGTANANPISMTAGLASMTQLTAETYDDLDRLGAQARSEVAGVFREAGIPMAVQGEGSVFAIVPGEGPVKDWRDYASRPWDSEKIGRFHRFLTVNGVLASQFLGFVLSTPMGEAEIERLVQVVHDGADLLGD